MFQHKTITVTSIIIHDVIQIATHFDWPTSRFFVFVFKEKIKKRNTSFLHTPLLLPRLKWPALGVSDSLVINNKWKSFYSKFIKAELYILCFN